MSFFSEKKLVLINKILIGATLLTPLVVHRLFISPFEVPRALYFRTVVGLLLIAYVALAARFPQYRPQWRKPMVLTTLIFLGVLFFTAIVGVQWHRSFWGTLSRSGGLLHWVHLGVFFLVLPHVMQKKKDWAPFLYLFSTVALLVALYGFAQKLDLGFVYESGVDRATGTIGNAALFAGVMIFGIYSFALSYFQTSHRWLRIYCVVGAVLTFVALALSQTRGAMVGFVGSLLFLFLLYAFVPRFGSKKKKQWARVIFVVGLLFLAGLFFYRDSSLVQQSTLLKRFTNLELTNTTAQTRIFGWRGGLQAWTDRPIFGWGPENYTIAYNNYFDPEFYTYAKQETWFDRAHNTPIEFLTNTGVVGLVSYLSLLIVATILIIRRFRDESLSAGEAGALLALLVAYLGQNMLAFDSLNTWVGLFFVFGFVAALSQSPMAPSQPSQRSGRALLAVAGTAAVVFVGFVQINIPIASATMEMRDVRQQMVDPGYDARGALETLLRATGQGTPWDWEIIAENVDVLMDLVGDRFHKNITPDELRDALVVIADRFEQQDSPALLDAKSYARAARIYTLLSELDPATVLYQERAEYYLQQSIELGPNRPPAYYLLSQLYAFQERFEEGLVLLEDALSFHEGIPDSYWAFATLYSAQGDGEQVVFYVKEAIARSYHFRNLSDIEAVLPIFQQEQDFEGLEYLYIQALRFEPLNPQWHAALAGVYRETGQIDLARERANLILSIDPNLHVEIELFLETLETETE